MGFAEKPKSGIVDSMNKINLEILYLSFPYILLLLIVSFFSPWFVFLDRTYFLVLSFFFLGLQLFSSITDEFHFQNKRFLFLIFGLISSLMLLGFPVLDLRLGDGLILLESMYLETKIFGYHLILDEILEGLIHSIAQAVLHSSNPRLNYQILSTLCGLGLIVYFGNKYFSRRNGLLSFLVILSSGGFLLFYGYVENYTLLSTYIFFFYMLVLNTLEEGEKLSPWILGFLAGVGALFHLVFGYHIFALIYLTYIFSTNAEFFKNALRSTVMAGLVMSIIFGYFLFFSDVRLDLSQAHITNPKFYPWKRMISTNHFLEIFYCMILSSLPALVVLGYIRFFDRDTWNQYKTNSEFQFLKYSILGFFLHGFIFNPQLGFPADWDLMSFYWIPLAILAGRLVQRTQLPASRMMPILLFSFILLQANAFTLSQRDQTKEAELKQLISKIDTYAKTNRTEVLENSPKERKFFLKTDFFFFRVNQKLQENHAPSELLEKGNQLQRELHLRKGQYDKVWKREYLHRATKFHESYLEFTKKKSD
jgi:hypothetical protein